MKYLLLIFLFIAPRLWTYGQPVDIILIEPTGSTIDSLPEMKIIPEDDPIYKRSHELIHSTFIQESIELYRLAQVFLINQGKREEIEPAYIALTENQGGYAKKGFVIAGEMRPVKKPNTYYVDITKRSMQGDPGKLMSVTQLYPHELTHIIYRLLCSSDTLEETSNNVNIHFFSIITDFGIAFNEGFAEHMENVSRHYELNDSIKQGILDDIEQRKTRFPKYISGFKRDFLWPLRIGYYKSTMLFWYQQFEDFKRYEYAKNNLAKAKNASLSRGDLADRITFRNSGVTLADKKRNLVQSLATEGVISSFFTNVMLSELPDRYVSGEFYDPFISDPDQDLSPPQMFTPLQNQMMKFLYVLHNYVRLEQLEEPHLLSFVKGYLNEFPNDSALITEIFNLSTGHNIPQEMPPQIWLMTKSYNHRFIVIDPFGALTLPLYTFNLNAAEIEDLMTLGIEEQESNKIIDFRDSIGYFQSISEAESIVGLNQKTKNQIASATFDQEFFDELEDPDLDITSLISTPLLHLLKTLALWYVLIVIIRFIVFRKTLNTKNHIKASLLHLPMWIILVLIGLIGVIIQPSPVLTCLLATVIILIPSVIIVRKNTAKMRRQIVVSFLMVLALMISIY